MKTRATRFVTVKGEVLTLREAATLFGMSYSAVYRSITMKGEKDAVEHCLGHKERVRAPCAGCGVKTKNHVCSKKCSNVINYSYEKKENPGKKEKADQFDSGGKGRYDYRCKHALKCANYDEYMERNDWKKPCVPDGKCFDPVGSSHNLGDVVFESILEA